MSDLKAAGVSERYSGSMSETEEGSCAGTLTPIGGARGDPVMAPVGACIGLLRNLRISVCKVLEGFPQVADLVL